jgi:hypothetical protein
MDGRTGELLIDEWMDEWVEGWINAWKYGRMDKAINKRRSSLYL